MTLGVVALGVGMVFLGVTVLIAAWGSPGWLESRLGRPGPVATLGGVTVGLLAIGVWDVAPGG